MKYVLICYMDSIYDLDYKSELDIIDVATKEELIEQWSWKFSHLTLKGIPERREFTLYIEGNQVSHHTDTYKSLYNKALEEFKGEECQSTSEVSSAPSQPSKPSQYPQLLRSGKRPRRLRR